MNKLLKFLLWTLASIVILIILAAVLIPLLIDPNDFKDEIAAQVHKQTGRHLKIEGDIDLSFSLPLSVALDLGRVELSNAAGFGDEPFVKMQDASVFVSIWPLITKNQLNIGKVKLTGMELNLIKNDQGKTNWDDLSEVKSDTTTPAEQGKSAAVSEQGASFVPVITVESIAIKDARINWTDQQNLQQLTLSKTDISISQLIENTPFGFKLSTHLSSDKPAINGDITFNSHPTISLSSQLFQLTDTHLSIDLTGDALPGGKNKTTLMGNIVFDGQKQQLDISKMKLTSYDMVINGLFKAIAIDKGVQYNGKITIDPFSPKTLAASLGAALPEMKNSQALGSSNMQLEFSGDPKQLTISSLIANLDDTTLKGTATIKNFQTSHYKFDIELNQLDLDFYATAESTQKSKDAPEKAGQGKTRSDKTIADKTSKTSTSTAKPDTSPSQSPLETLRQLNLDGKLTIGKFKAGGAKMSNVVIILKGNKGIIELAPLKADLYSGKLNLNTTINATKDTPTIKLVNDLSHVKIGDLLMDTTGSNEFTGNANIKANITTSGKTKDQLLKNSNGSANLLITDGNIKSLDIISTLRTAQALYRGKVPPTQSQQENTKFTELKGTFKIKNGVVHNNDLYSRSPVMEFTGKGYADLPREYMDYTLKVKMLDSLKIDDKTGGTDYKGKEFPYTIKGTFSELSQTASIDKVLEQQAIKAIEKKLNREIERRFGDKFKDLIKF
jgi:AsmA protein